MIFFADDDGKITFGDGSRRFFLGQGHAGAGSIDQFQPPGFYLFVNFRAHAVRTDDDGLPCFKVRRFFFAAYPLLRQFGYELRIVDEGPQSGALFSGGSGGDGEETVGR